MQIISRLAFVCACLAFLIARPASAAPDDPGPSAPPPLPWPGTDPVVPLMEDVGFLPGRGSISNTGEYRYTLPLDVPDGRAGMSPRLSLEYSSRGGNGVAGISWTIDFGGSEIRRCHKAFWYDAKTDSPDYEPDDALCLDGQRLVQVSGPGPVAEGAEYRTHRDTFGRIIARGVLAESPTWFEVFTKEGRIRRYSGLQARRIDEEGGVALVTPVWVMTEERDRNGNAISYEHEVTSEASPPYAFEHRIRSIRYTERRDETGQLVEPAYRKVVFAYGSRPDLQVSYRGGIRYVVRERLVGVYFLAPYPTSQTLAWSYRLGYSGADGHSFLETVQQEAPNGTLGRRHRRFEWAHTTRPDFEAHDVEGIPSDHHWVDHQLFDADGDGKDELALRDKLCFTTTKPFDHCVSVPGAQWLGRSIDLNGDGRAEINTPNGYVSWDPATQSFKSVDYGSSNPNLIDVHGDGLPDSFIDIRVHGTLPNEELNEEDDDWYVQKWGFHRNTGAAFHPDVELFNVAPAFMAAPPWNEPAPPAVFDLNGDGRGELHIGYNNMTANVPSQCVPNGTWTWLALGFSDKGTLTTNASYPQGPTCKGVLADVNGDGLKDRLHLAGPDSTVQYNTGTGFLPAEPYATNIFPRYGKHRFQSLDVDGDGRDDLISSHEASSFEGSDHRTGTYLHLLRSNGVSTIDLGPLGVPAHDPDGLPVGLQPNSPVIRPADVNGDGLVDLVVLTRKMSTQYVPGFLKVRALVQRWEPQHVVVGVWDDGNPWPRESVEYDYRPTDNPSPSQCQYPARCIRGGMVTARKHRVRRHAGSKVTARYEFDDPRSDVRGRGFLGFGTVRVVEGESRAETISVFDHQTSEDGRYPFASIPSDTWRIVPILPEAPDVGGGVYVPASGEVIARVWHAHATPEMRPLNGGATYAVFQTGQRTEEWEQRGTLTTSGVKLTGPESSYRVREQVRTFDDHGNETTSQSWTVGGQRCETSTTYDNRTGEWLLGLPVTTEVSCNEDGQPLPEPRRTTMGHDALGQLVVVTVEPDHVELKNTKVYTRDERGLVTRITWSAPGEWSRRTYLAYDAEGVYPRATWNDLGHYNQQLVHPALGVPVIGEDPNGVQVHYRYDALGRVVEVDPDAGAGVAVSYAHDASRPWLLAVTRSKEDGPESTETVDEWGRTVRAARRGFDGQWVHERTDYNFAGRATKLYRPTKGQPSLFTEITFDTLGRVLRVVEPDGAITTHVHTKHETTTTDPEGRQRRVTRDPDERVVATADLYRGSWTAVSYRYGSFGQVTDTTDAQGNTVFLGYDKLGRRTSLDDPDRGLTTWTHNGFGEVRTETDALGDTTVFERDVLGRVLWKNHDQDGATTYEYDGQGARGEIGRLTAASSPDGVAMAYEYDVRGRNTRTSWLVGTDTYEVGRTYDAFGRVRTIKYPPVPGRARFTVKHEYNGVGYASSISDLSDPSDPVLLWQVTDRNEEDELRESAFANGVAEHRRYDPTNGRLTDIEAVRSGDALYAMHYERDLTGNITERHDYAPAAPRIEMFDHDSLDRLSRWTVFQQGEVRETGYEYDLIGNLSRVTGSSGTETFTHGGYPGDGALELPHGLAGRTAGGQSFVFQYDSRGRQTAGDGRVTTYRSFDLPATIQARGETTTFLYDPFHRRARKTRTVAGGEEGTDTIGDLYERRWSPGDPTEHVFYVHGTDGPVAQIVYTAHQPLITSYLHREALGSVGLITDSQGAEVERAYHEPFGARVNALGEPVAPTMKAVKLGFTGHRHDDELGLVDMKGRLYDPAQRRFHTPDPIVGNPWFGQSYNRYAYVHNNPLRYTDPTGFRCSPADKRCAEFMGPGFTLGTPWAVHPEEPSVRYNVWWQSRDTVVTEIVASSGATDATKTTNPRDGPAYLAENKGHGWYTLFLWGGIERAAETAVYNYPPVATLRHAWASAATAFAAIQQLSGGEHALAANTILDIPQQMAEAAGATLFALAALPATIETAATSPDPEQAGAAAVKAVEQAATVAGAVVAGVKAAAQRTPRAVSGAQRDAVLQRARGSDGVPRCRYCDTPLRREAGASNSAEVDHRKAYSKGGETTDSNLDAACRTCNRSKGSKELGTEWIPPNQRR